MTILLIDGVGRSEQRDVPEHFGDVYRVPRYRRFRFAAGESMDLPDFTCHTFRHTGEFMLRGTEGLAILPIYRLKAGA